ncbi:unnamed protein product [Lathyrus oleraceus]|uniref:Uncharacterized protein n=1 Tax=Pisum sativum TaxID=3888 RepID=A0A9D5ATF4_PEA|nr:uncharacterized protein LOC127128805 [Pisum sativum]KAI5423727.1 hypothetical protein KIW84_030088 [Pisum sativum]
MANPPPVRPWFRLTSIRPVSAPAPAPAPAPESRPIMPLPAFQTASTPPSPHNQTQPQEKKTEQPPSSPPHRVLAPNSYSSSSSLPSSPIHKPTHYSSSSSSPEKTTTNTSRLPIPTQSPKTIKQNVLTPTHSPKTKYIYSPPSPLTLPPSHSQFKTHEERSKIPMEAEPKAVLVQKTVDVPKPWHNGNSELHPEAHNHSNSSHRGTKHSGNGEFHRETQNHSNSSHHGNKHVTVEERETKERKFSDSEDSGMRVITIAGENRGAYMELVQSQKKHEPNYLHKKGNLKSNGIKVSGGESEFSSAEEGKINKNDKNHKGRTKSSFPMAAYMNSNVQCVNNSLLFHASCSHHDPGVRLSLSKKPFGESYHVKEHVNGGDYN